jgi:hypothetical protein
MIRALRQRHRATVIALAVVVPAAFALGIAARREIPVSPSAASGLSAVARDASVLWSRDDLWDKKPIRTRLLASRGTGQRAVELVLRDPIVRPDLLLYWVPGEAKLRNSLPDGAFLLGGLEQSNPNPLALPAMAGDQPGVLVIYSLADHELLAVSREFAAVK